jgi:hypothetical protein
MSGSPLEAGRAHGAPEPYQRDMAAAYNELLSSSASGAPVRARLGLLSTPEKHFHGVDTRAVLQNLARSLTSQRRNEDTYFSYVEKDLQVRSTLEKLNEPTKKAEARQESESGVSGLFDTSRDEPIEREIFPNEGSEYEDDDQSEELGADDFQAEASNHFEEGSEYTHEDVLAVGNEDNGGDDSYIAKEAKNYSYNNSIGNGDRDDGKEEFEHTNAESYGDHDEGTKLVNSPSSRAPPCRPQDLDGIISHERTPTTEEVRRLQKRHHELEDELQLLHTKQEQDHDSNYENSNQSGPCLEYLKEHAGAVDIAPGVVVVDPEKLDKLLNGEKVEDGAPIFMPDHVPSLTSELPSSPSSEMGSILSQAGSSPERPISIRFPSFGVKCDSTPTPSTLNPPTVVTSPGGKHIEFTNGSSPFAVNCFRSHRGKENSPSKKSPNKARRNDSLPEEIAEWAREAHVGEVGEDEKEKAMEKGGEEADEDLASLDPIVEHEGKEDVPTVCTSTPPSAHPNKDQQKIISPPPSPEQSLLSRTSDVELLTYKLDILYHKDSALSLELETNASPSQTSDLTPQEGDELDGSAEDVDKAARVRPPLSQPPTLSLHSLICIALAHCPRPLHHL